MDMGAYEFGSPAACTGGEKFNSKCFNRWNTNYLNVIVKKNGQPGATLTFRMGGERGSDTFVPVPQAGITKTRFKALAAGRHHIDLLECMLSRRTRCP